MVPAHDEAGIPATTGDEHSVEHDEPIRSPAQKDLAMSINLGAVEQLGGPKGELLARYLRMIVVQRGDYAVRTLAIRRDDLTAFACIFRNRPSGVPTRLTRIGVCSGPEPNPATWDFASHQSPGCRSAGSRHTLCHRAVLGGGQRPGVGGRPFGAHITGSPDPPWVAE
jgi:hypothetical protein